MEFEEREKISFPFHLESYFKNKMAWKGGETECEEKEDAAHWRNTEMENDS